MFEEDRKGRKEERMKEKGKESRVGGRNRGRRECRLDRHS